MKNIEILKTITEAVVNAQQVNIRDKKFIEPIIEKLLASIEKQNTRFYRPSGATRGRNAIMQVTTALDEIAPTLKTVFSGKDKVTFIINVLSQDKDFVKKVADAVAKDLAKFKEIKTAEVKDIIVPQNKYAPGSVDIAVFFNV